MSKTDPDSAPVILWLRQDLRLRDQAALAAACDSGAPVIPVYVLDDDTPGQHRMSGASRWWLHHSLESLASALKDKGSRLILRRGDSVTVLAELAKETGADAVYAIDHAEPWWRQAQEELAKRTMLDLQPGNYLAPFGSVRTGSGTPFKIYTPFWRALQEQMPPHRPTLAPRTIAAPSSWPASDRLADWNLLPTKPDWAGGMRREWTPGEDGAHERLSDFADRAAQYEQQRDLPSIEGTSMLSPHLHFGEITPAQVWHAVADKGGSVRTFLSEIGWRDYAANVILQFPDYGTQNARKDFDKLPWRYGKEADADLAAWQQGRTGYPIVDAGMRQLWATGWMHNRVRMIAASFLIKHLLIDWRRGEEWFWDTLVDADYASNAVNWQWTAGTGVDSNMFVRIMAPLTQSDKFDAAGYIREWVPELAHLSADEIHDPAFPVKGYPEKRIDHREARERALAAYRTIKS